MKPSAPINQATNDQTDLEFALETQSGFLVVVKGSGNDGRVTLAVRRRVGTPPASAIGLSPDEVKRLINLLCELSPLAAQERDKHLIDKARDAYLDDLVGTHNEPENPGLDLFMESDFPDLANRRKRKDPAKTFLTAPKTILNAPKTFLGAPSSNPVHKLTASLAGLRLRPKQIAISAVALLVVLGGALATVALLNSHSFSHEAAVNPDMVVPAPAAGIEDFSKNFVLDMLTFKADTYRQAQVRAMAEMTPELAQRYWKETGFPLSRKQLKSIPQDQLVQLSTANAVPLSAGLFQVDVEGSVVSNAGAQTLPLHIRLTVSKDAAGKLTVTEQKDLSSSGAKQ